MTRPQFRPRWADNPSPTPAEIIAARQRAGLTQTEAALLVSSRLRTWQDWEGGKVRMHAGLWELFRIKSRSVKRKPLTR